jgi:hypothetical protein
VVDAVLEDPLERTVRFGPRDGAECGGSEERARALVAVPPNGASRSHPQIVETARVPYDLISVGNVMLDGALPAPVPGGRVHGRIELRVGGSAANAALAAALRGDAFALRVRRHHERAVGAALDRPGGPAAAVVLHLGEGHEFGPDGGWTFKWD